MPMYYNGYIWYNRVIINMDPAWVLFDSILGPTEYVYYTDYSSSIEHFSTKLGMNIFLKKLIKVIQTVN